MSLNQSKMRNTSYSLFNDPSETESQKIPLGEPEDSKKVILKLAEDTLNFIDQELTKSYKVTSIGTKPSKTLDKDKSTQEDNLKSIGKLNQNM